jgi:hypothetical protein
MASDRVLISTERYLSRKELIRVDPTTKERFSKPLYSLDQVINMILVPVKFFQDNGLLTRKLVTGPESISAQFELRRSDLTDLGYELFRSAYPKKWLGALERKGHAGVDAQDAEQLRQDWLRSGKADQIFKNHLKKLKEKHPDLE